MIKVGIKQLFLLGKSKAHIPQPTHQGGKWHYLNKEPNDFLSFLLKL